jgi:hypothetical protein
LTFLSANLESEPSLALAIVKINIASGEIGDVKRGHHRFIGDILQARQFQIDLDLPLRRNGQNKADQQECELHGAVE